MARSESHVLTSIPLIVQVDIIPIEYEEGVITIISRELGWNFRLPLLCHCISDSGKKKLPIAQGRDHVALHHVSHKTPSHQ